MAVATEAEQRSEEAHRRRAEQIGQLLDSFRQSTAVYSATWQIKSHPSFQNVRDLGWSAVPSLINRLSDPCVQWLIALSEITGDDPVLPEHAGEVRMMAEDWKK